MSPQNTIFRKEQCPWGKKAIDLLEKKNINFDDHIFSSKEEEENFKEEHNVKTTPQIFLKGRRIGGFTDLAEHFGIETRKDKKSYRPVIALFATSALMTLAVSGDMKTFMGYSLCLLSLLKLMDLSSFVTSFKKYDLLTKKFTAYGYFYPFAELAAGLGFLSGQLPIATGGLSLFVGVAGGISIIKAVYIDKTDLNCACVGGNQNVPLGFVSFSENAMMALMGGYLLFQTL